MKGPALPYGLEAARGLAAVGRHLRGARRVLLALHESPDGDAVGSNLALAHALWDAGTAAEVVSHDPVGRPFGFLPGVERIADPDQVGGPFDVACLVDSSDPERTGRARALIARAELVVNIDHHKTNSRFGAINVVVPRAAACGELIYYLLKRMRRRITPAIATCLYTAIDTDTGSFRFDNTTAATHAVAARLVRAGARPAAIAAQLYDHRPLSTLRLTALALGALAVSPRGRVAWITVPRTMLAAAGASEEETEGLVGYPRSLDGAEVAMVFRELADGRVRVSFRSKLEVDVAELAAGFGGGGHARAAGATVDGPLPAAVQRVVAAARRVAEADGPPGDEVHGGGP